jgi:type IV pilus assembly protein PilM
MRLTDFSKGLFTQIFDFKKEYFSKIALHQVTGIDINSDFIKLLTIDQNTTPYRIENFSILPLPENVVVKNEIKDPQTIANLLKKSIYETGINTKTVALAVNRSAAIIKTLTVDKRLSLDEIESRIWVEANRLFPNLVADIYLDFAILDSSIDPTQLEIILAACRKEQMRPYLEIMEHTDLTPKIIDINCYAFERALTRMIAPYPELKTVALLNIDFTLITLIVVQEKNLIYTHELSYDGHSHKKNDDNKRDGLLASIGLHLRHSMQFFYSSKPNTPIQKIVLTGDCAVHVPGMNNFIQQEINIEVISPDLFSDMTMNPNINQEKIKYHQSQLTLSCGLALSKLI